MTWRAYQVVLRLRSPMHVGWGKVGNLQRTRPYVTGRVLWGAVTTRLTRDAAQGRGPTADSREYRGVGEQVHQFLAFSYFYLARRSGDGYQVVWPWESESAFRRRFLGSYASTALAYPFQSAAEGTLHEVEFIASRTLDAGEPVFLLGYLFEKNGSLLDWRSAFHRLQIGGERGYGWGDVELVDISPVTSERLFDGALTFCGDGAVPIVHLPNGGRLLAHTRAADLPVAGDVEPLVGREWRSDNSRRRYVGQHVEFMDICFCPGSVVRQALHLAVGRFGVWQRTGAQA
jgi:hypothetical protein